MCVCVCVCVCVCACVRAHVYMYVWARACVCVRVRVGAHVCVYEEALFTLFTFIVHSLSWGLLIKYWASLTEER